MIAEGKYRAKATDAQLGFTGGGKEQVAVAFEFLDLPGEHLTWYGFFTEKTLDRTMESLRFCGWYGDDLTDLSGVTDNEVELVVVHEEDQDKKMRARINWVNRAGSSKAQIKNVMPDDQKRAFAARMRGAALASKSKLPPKSAATPAANTKKQPPQGAGDAWEEPPPAGVEGLDF